MRSATGRWSYFEYASFVLPLARRPLWLAAAGLSVKELSSLPGSDVRKVALANLVLERTVARQSWIAEKLAVRSAANLSQQVRRYRAKRPRLTAAFKEYLQSVKI